jgi:glycosyltransferase involved in cell wall biosynthesis
VVDSFSDDKTVEIAKTFTNKVFQNPWPGFSKQRTFALTKTSHDWVLWLDADEEASPELIQEITALDFKKDGYRIPRLVFYLGRWIKHCGWHPDYTLRLFNKQKGGFTDVLVHESFTLSGKTKKLKNPILHYPYKNIAHHLDKMNIYTSLSSHQMHMNGKRTMLSSVFLHAFFYFVKTYFVKRGFLDGGQGFVISTLGSFYVFLKYFKLWEMQSRKAMPR